MLYIQYQRVKKYLEGDAMNQIELFKQVREKVPAYAEFCKLNNIKQNPSWEEIPLTDKPSYLLKFPLENLCWDGDLTRAFLIGASSGFGKSGSVFWPKRAIDEKNYLEIVENMFVENNQIDKKRTLILVCLAFGTWIAGMQLAATVRTLAQTGKYPLICATPGLNLQEAVEIYKTLENSVEQVIIITNPSNINIFISLFRKNNLQINRGNIYFPVVGEYIPEKMRIKITKELGFDENEPFVIMTGFGSADTGDLGYETREIIYLRRYIYNNPHISKKIFNTLDTPMIFSMNPKAYIEIIDGEIVVTKDQLIPLIRYNTKDRGGILNKEILADDIPENIYEKLPEKMLYVFGRTSDSIIFYGTNLNVGDINNFFLSLDKSYSYGGLFQVKQELSDGMDVFVFTVFTEDFKNEQLILKYKEALIEFLCSSSNEFKIKYQNLSQVVGEKLIQVKLDNISNLEGNLKHKFIV